MNITRDKLYRLFDEKLIYQSSFIVYILAMEFETSQLESAIREVFYNYL